MGEEETVVPDIEITCGTCQKAFVWTSSDQEFYAKHDYKRPKRCKACRENRAAVVECCPDMAELVKRRLVRATVDSPILVVHFVRQETKVFKFCPFCGVQAKVDRVTRAPIVGAKDEKGATA